MPLVPLSHFPWIVFRCLSGCCVKTVRNYRRSRAYRNTWAKYINGQRKFKWMFFNSLKMHVTITPFTISLSHYYIAWHTYYIRILFFYLACAILLFLSLSLLFFSLCLRLLSCCNADFPAEGLIKAHLILHHRNTVIIYTRVPASAFSLYIH